MATASAGMTYYFLSQLLGARVRFEGEKAPFGQLHDIGVRKTGPYPQATVLEVRSRSRGRLAVPWNAVADFSPAGVAVRGDWRPVAVPMPATGIRPRPVRGDRPKEPGTVPPAEFWLRRDVLDDQVVDVSGAKVWRVNDVRLLYAEGHLIVGHVSVGLLGILRRLGIARPVSALVHWLLDYTVNDGFVPWGNVEVISPGGSPGGVRVSALPSRLAELHPAEVADILEQLSVSERQALLNTLDLETAAEAIEELDPDVQRTFITQEDPDKAADILEEMPANEAADLLRDMHDPDAQRIISRMESETAEDVRMLLSQEEESAGGVMTTSCIEVNPTQTAGEVLGHIRPMAEDVDVFNIIYVLDEGRHLLGAVSLRELFRAAPEATLDSLMTTHLVKVLPDTSLRDLGRLFAKYGLRAIPVVDEQEQFLGAIRLRNALEELAPLLRE